MKSARTPKDQIPKTMQPDLKAAFAFAVPAPLGRAPAVDGPGATAYAGHERQSGVVRDWIAESRVRVEQLRLLVLKTAWLMDTVGNKGAHTEIQAIKIATPQTVQWILDKAIQVHGAGCLSVDFPLAQAYAGIRTLRFANGPDEAHTGYLLRRRRTADLPGPRRQFDGFWRMSAQALYAACDRRPAGDETSGSQGNQLAGST
ncbi:acyl-CoA dehydrogenase family protein [Leekyejoonella antrihumi]|uniref:acyl-CoA dehydrogenase family protein n=1 Tax=Leekyejoonella antrihumi TaxID=1660198 RepID=UPI003CCC7F92